VSGVHEWSQGSPKSPDHTEACQHKDLDRPSHRARGSPQFPSLWLPGFKCSVVFTKGKLSGAVCFELGLGTGPGEGLSQWDGHRDLCGKELVCSQKRTQVGEEGEGHPGGVGSPVSPSCVFPAGPPHLSLPILPEFPGTGPLKQAPSSRSQDIRFIPLATCFLGLFCSVPCHCVTSLASSKSCKEVRSFCLSAGLNAIQDDLESVMCW
jgi:hypothetical protein